MLEFGATNFLEAFLHFFMSIERTVMYLEMNLDICIDVWQHVPSLI